MAVRKKIPFVAFGNEELDKKESIGKGDEIPCPNSRCRKLHPVRLATDSQTGEESDFLQFVTCGKNSYLVGVKGKALE